jgi:hypothetical protein
MCFRDHITSVELYDEPNGNDFFIIIHSIRHSKPVWYRLDGTKMNGAHCPDIPREWIINLAIRHGWTPDRLYKDGNAPKILTELYSRVNGKKESNSLFLQHTNQNSHQFGISWAI